MTQAKKTQTSETNPIWGGHYAMGPADAFALINPSIAFDQRLYLQDITGSLAHCQMLEACDIITAEDSKAMQQGLKQIKEEIESGQFDFRPELEDIHMNIEARLKDIIGDVAGKLHTARSRNDQVATDFRLFVRDAAQQLRDALEALKDALIAQAESHADTIMPGFTHLQTAQPVTFGHHLMAYIEMFSRDQSRLSDTSLRANECPLGAAALAGTSFPIDRDMTAQKLGFGRPMRNSLDAVSDRDFALEFLSATAICAMHLSRLSEELIIWTSAPFHFITLPESFTSGSSIMPQKRNPDAAELIRGKTGRIAAQFPSLLMVMKALPLAYNKDSQEDKEPVFEAFDQLMLCLRAMTGMVASLEADKEAMHAAAEAGYATATDLADWLVRALNLPFREAHHITGAIVALAEKDNLSLDALSLEQMHSIEPRITEEVFSVLSVEASVNSRTSVGGTAPQRVREAITKAKEKT